MSDKLTGMAQSLTRSERATLRRLLDRRDRDEESQEASERRMVSLVRAAISPDLLAPRYAAYARIHRLAGHCYAASEALYHLLGGRASGYTPHSARDEFGGVHWWLQTAEGRILDPTADQYYIGRHCAPPYGDDSARGRGFLTLEPSKRARVIMCRVNEARYPDQHTITR